MKTLYEFIDYRKFLEEYYKEKKKSTRYFSYRYFSQRAGINSPSFLKQVIEGKRNLTEITIDKFCSALKLNNKESLYFRHLVLFNQASSNKPKQEHYAILRSMCKNVKESVLQGSQYDYFKNWYTVVIRELICIHDFNDDFEAISKTIIPNITAPKVKMAIKLLLKLGLIEKDGKGKYNQTEKAITADDEITSIAIREFTKKMFDHAKIAIDNIDKQNRNISGLTIGISPQSFDIISSEIDAFKDRIKRIVADDENSSQVYQLNLALFPMSNNIENAMEDKED